MNFHCSLDWPGTRVWQHKFVQEGHTLLCCSRPRVWMGHRGAYSKLGWGGGLSLHWLWAIPPLNADFCNSLERLVCDYPRFNSRWSPTFPTTDSHGAPTTRWLAHEPNPLANGLHLDSDGLMELKSAIGSVTSPTIGIVSRAKNLFFIINLLIRSLGISRAGHLLLVYPKSTCAQNMLKW